MGQHMWVRRDVVGTLGRPRCRWVDDSKMDIKRNRMGRSATDLYGLGQGQVAGSCDRANYSFGSITCGDWLKKW